MVSINSGSSGQWTAPLQTIANNYAIYVEKSAVQNGNTCNFENGVNVNGNVFINNYLVLLNNTPYPIISGDVYSSQTVTKNNGTITGNTYINQAIPANAPTLDSTYYDAQIAIADSKAGGDQTFNSSTAAGYYYVNGNAYIQSGFTTTGLVTIVAAQTIQTSTNLPNHIWLIAQSSLTIGAGYTFGNDSYFYARTAINANPTTTGGTGNYQGVRFITPGNLTMNDNYNFRGFIYCGGNSQFATNITFIGLAVCDNLTRLGQNCSFTKDPTIITFDAVVGVSNPTPQAGSFEVYPWYEPY